MADVDLIIDRLKARVPDLGMRVFGAAEFAALTATGAVPQVTPAVHVIPSGITGGKQNVQIGAYIQAVERMFSVILTLRAGDASGGRVLDRVSDFIESIIAALAGWELGDRIGVLQFRRCTLARAANGVFAYELTFSLSDQLRITPS
ncbi:phage tail terminator protein [Cypionkella psychrotolerans]|uniref:phage tail terminator protein n=1 Tax=Cypionkella psychrotolerans TaxID=1678131 RepID=UPI0006B61535|nr:hypothetical protein [Cypionkella psychrotolerans]